MNGSQHQSTTDLINRNDNLSIYVISSDEILVNVTGFDPLKDCETKDYGKILNDLDWLAYKHLSEISYKLFQDNGLVKWSTEIDTSSMRITFRQVY